MARIGVLDEIVRCGLKYCVVGPRPGPRFLRAFSKASNLAASCLVVVVGRRAESCQRFQNRQPRMSRFSPHKESRQRGIKARRRIATAPITSISYLPTFMSGRLVLLDISMSQPRICSHRDQAPSARSARHGESFPATAGW